MNGSTETSEILDHVDDLPFHWRSVLFMTFGLFGIIDNGLVLVIIGSAKSLWNPTNFLIANQSLIDLTTSALLLTLTITTGNNLYPNRPGLARFVCIFWMSWYPFWATITASSANLLLITYERFCAIVYPIRYRQRMTTKRIALVSAIPWVYGFCINSFIIIFSGIDGNECYVVRYPSKDVQLGLSFSVFGLHFVVLIVTISVLYIIIAVHLRRGPGLGGKTTVVNLRERARRNVLRTLFIVFVCYIICWAPNDIFVLNHTLKEGTEFKGTVYDLTVLMAFGNVWINPVIYSFRYEKFQKALKRLFCCKGTYKRKELPSISL